MNIQNLQPKEKAASAIPFLKGKKEPLLLCKYCKTNN